MTATGTTDNRPAGGPSDGLVSSPPRLRQLLFYLPYAVRFVVLRRPAPLIYGIALTDRCNLHCRGCTVANTGRPGMAWDRVHEAPTTGRTPSTFTPRNVPR